MKRKLSEQEKNNIIKLSKTEISLLGNYANVIRIILPIITILLFIFLYSQIKLGNIIFYIIIALILSIIEITQISKLQSPFQNILKDKYLCFESEMINNRKNRIYRDINNQTVKIVYRYYVSIIIDNQSKEIEYKGKNFDKLKLGDKMIVIEYNSFKKKNYICFSYNELNN